MWLAPAGASSCTPCSPGSYLASTGPGRPDVWRNPAHRLVCGAERGREPLAIGPALTRSLCAREARRPATPRRNAPRRSSPEPDVLRVGLWVRLNGWARRLLAAQGLRRPARAGSAWLEAIRPDQDRHGRAPLRRVHWVHVVGCVVIDAWIVM